MQFRIVSGTPGGFYSCSERLAPQEAASLFLSLTRSCFPEQLDNPLMSEVSLREYVEQDGDQLYIIYSGAQAGWKIALVPSNAGERIPSAN